jgi:tRNA-Thr(GGU) m(6)t(6)A37 methyltransferase TsaA
VPKESTKHQALQARRCYHGLGKSNNDVSGVHTSKVASGVAPGETRLRGKATGSGTPCDGSVYALKQPQGGKDMDAVFQPVGRAIAQDGRYFIELERRWLDATLGLAEYSHIQVLWWFNLTDIEEARTCLVIDKPYLNGPDRVGVLATRGPVRPNPIAVTVCELIAIDEARARIEVAYLDAEDGTPVLDIKPYHPSSDRIRDVCMPAWCAHWPGCYEESGAFDWAGEFNF